MKNIMFWTSFAILLLSNIIFWVMVCIAWFKFWGVLTLLAFGLTWMVCLALLFLGVRKI